MKNRWIIVGTDSSLRMKAWGIFATEGAAKQAAQRYEKGYPQLDLLPLPLKENE